MEKKRSANSGKSITEFKFYNQADLGSKDKKKPKYESRKMVLNSRVYWKIVETF